MTALDRLANINIKVTRAKLHLSLLTTEVKNYLDSQPYEVSVMLDLNKRPRYYITKIRPPRPDISAILGEIIYNLRSSFDHLAYQLVLLGSAKTPSNRVYFPIADNQLTYFKIRDSYLMWVSPLAIAEIDSLKPYKSGNELLWMLHKLNIIDKHRTLITAGSACRSINIGATFDTKVMYEHLKKVLPGGTDLSKYPEVDLFIPPADRQFPLRQGYQLFTDLPNAEPNKKIQFRFELGLGEKEVAYDKPLLDTLTSMVTLVESNLPRFESFLG